MGAHAEWHSAREGIMGTEINVTLWHPSAEEAQAAIDDVMGEMRRIDQLLSPYKQDSELSKVNAQAAQAPQQLSAEMALLVDKSLFVSRVSDGAFDITFASLGSYYNYREGQKPSDAQREEAMPAINYRWLDFDKSRGLLSYRHDKVRIDLGGIAKGYAVDRAIILLKARGIEHASVSAGGDSRLLGDRRGRPWIIGIKHPRPHSGDEASVIKLPLSDVALSTSGDYERYFIDEHGERIHHIINPRTGRSASEVMSVSVIGRDGLDTDPLSTTVFVLGVERGLALINQLPGFDAVIIDREGKVHYSEGLAPSN